MNEATQTDPGKDRPAAEPTLRGKLVERGVLFAAAFALWVLLVWPFAPTGGRPLDGDIFAGVIAAFVVALVMGELVTQRFGRLLDPRRYFWAVVYLPVFLYYALVAGVDVMYRVLHPALPINPGIVRARTRLRSASARTALATSITLTPGTLSVDVTADGTFYVHWINVVSLDDEESAARILGRFEWFIERIFEEPGGTAR